MANERIDRDALRRTVLDGIVRLAPEVDPAALRPSAPLRDQVDLDSMDVLNFIVGLHERLGVDIPEADYGTLTSIDAIVEYLAMRLGGAPAPPAAG